MKAALESYWREQSSRDELKALGAELRRPHSLDQSALASMVAVAKTLRTSEA